jgi:hypothetical protein
VPLTIELRERALAKSNRPYEFLGSAGIAVRASVARRKIVAPARPRDLAALSNQVLHATGAGQVRELSAIESLKLWDPVIDAMGVGGIGEGRALLQGLERENHPIAMELFPWLTPGSLVDRDTTIAQYLTRIGFHIEYESHVGRRTLYAYLDSPSIEGLLELPGLRAAYAAPMYGADHSPTDDIIGDVPELGAPSPDSPIVGVLDSGVEPKVLGPWLAGHEAYVIPRDEDRSHGTFVAGLVANSRALNGGDAKFPADRCRVFDAQIFSPGGIADYLLMERIGEAVEKYGDKIKVWNCSISMTKGREPGSYSQVAAFMDELARSKGVTFVQSAGNYATSPPRKWPYAPDDPDGLYSPGEAVDSITVGALTHIAGAVTDVGMPASYTRKGPGLVGVVKPDVCHYSGDVDEQGDASVTGVRSYAIDGGLHRSVGTSYSAPIVSATVATVVDALSAPDSQAFRKNLLARALLVHAARQRPSTISDEHRSYYGNGVPPSAVDVISDSPEEFTTMYLVQFSQTGEWVKRDFPIPQCLTVAGKLRAELFLTVAHDPVIDANYDQECIRTSVEGQLGPLLLGKRGLPTIDTKVPTESALQGWEAELAERGKWSPIRTYYRKFSRMRVSGEWGLKLSLMERLEKIQQPVQVAVLVTFRGLDDGLPVRTDGVRALRQAGHATQEVVASTRVRIQGSA